MTWWKASKYDLTGQTFGSLTALLRTSTTGKSQWLCACSCGRSTTTSAANLKKGAVKSCGCARKGCNKKRPYEWLYNTLLSCVRGKHSTPLTYIEFLSFTTVRNCEYCRATVYWEPHSVDMCGKSRAYNLDRKDNSLGYESHNLVVCCQGCNFTKGDRFTYEEFLRIGGVIESIRAERQVRHAGA